MAYQHSLGTNYTKCKSRDSDKWKTPPEIYNPLHKEFKFNYDPCPIDWKEGDLDGLTSEWGTRNFVNPPYSCATKWITKASEESKKGKLVVMLINTITDTKAFHKYIYHKAEIRFIKGRVRFTNISPTLKKTQANPRPSMIIIF